MDRNELPGIDHIQEVLLDLRFRDLLLFILVYEHRKLSEAASIMHISTPTAERKLKLLRQTFSDQLFTRGGIAGAFMVPTERAKTLYPVVKALFGQWIKAVPKEHFDPGKITNVFRLAVNGHGIFFIPKDFFPQFFSKCPSARISIVRPTDDIFETIRHGHADCGLSFAPLSEKHIEGGFHQSVIYRGGAVLAVRQGHPLASLAQQRPLTVTDIRQFPQVRLVSKARRHFVERFLDESLAEENLGLEAKMTTPYFFTGLMSLRGTDFVCICPEVIAQPWEEAGHIQLLHASCISNQFSLHLIWHERTDKLPEYQFIRSLLLSRQSTSE